jgi:peptide/nickel transport system ATP-binding protein
MVMTQGSIREPLLELKDLKTWFFTREGTTRAVDGLSFSINPGETLALVGESGCGKSVTSLSILRLIASPPGRVVGGSIRFKGRDLLGLSDREMRSIRGNEIAMIFQEPMTSLNPVRTVGWQIAEALIEHRGMKGDEATREAEQLLKLVHIPDAARRVNEYPHQFSGGMRQRVMIAMALACSPQLLIADEPTTALDVTIQAQILLLMRELQKRSGAAVLLITHDLGVVAEMAQRVIVMYAGRKVEEALVKDLFDTPKHPYTIGLLNSVPRLGASLEQDDSEERQLAEIPGIVPSLKEPIVGCSFAPRCFLAQPLCSTTAPNFEEKAAGHFAACHFRPTVVSA